MTQADQIAQYLDRVRAALADLPAETRDELIEDLPDHLAEVLAEDTGSLTDRLGAPEAYAEELRAAAGMAAPVRRPALDAPRLRAAMARLNRNTGSVLGYQRASDLWAQLRPGWWVFRGYVIGLLLLAVIYDSSQVWWLPNRETSMLVWLAAVGACVVASVRLGQLTPRLRRWGQVAVGLIAVGLVAMSLASLNQDHERLRTQTAAATVVDPFASVTDIYPYDEAGRPLSGVRLFDQNGVPFVLGRGWCPRTMSPATPEFRAHPDGSGEMWIWVVDQASYPLCPPAGWTAGATPVPSAGATPVPTPGPPNSTQPPVTPPSSPGR